MSEKNKINLVATLLADYAHIAGHSMYRYMNDKAPLRLEMREAERILTRDLVDIIDEVIQKKSTFQEYMNYFVDKAEVCVKNELESFDARLRNRVLIVSEELDELVKNCFETKFDAMMQRKLNAVQNKIDVLASEVYSLRRDANDKKVSNTSKKES